VCQLDTLGKCRNRAMLRKALAALPPTLDKTYERILCAIAEEDAVYAIRVLLWLAFSDRPLTIEEVAEVVAIDVARDPAFDREEVLEDPLETLDICSSLVTTDNQANSCACALLCEGVPRLRQDPTRPGSAIQYSGYGVPQFTS
jgi:hypothetical protein